MNIRDEIAKELENYYINQVIKDRNSKYNNTNITITDKDIKKILENIKNDNLMEAWVILKIIEKRIDTIKKNLKPREFRSTKYVEEILEEIKEMLSK